MKKNTARAALQRKLKLYQHCRRHLSADELSVFSSALRPCLRFLLENNAWPKVKKSAMIAILGVVGFTIFSASSPVYAADASDSTMTLTVPDTISVTVEPGGEMNTATGKIKVNTNARYGYNLTIKAKDPGEDLTSSVLNDDGSIKVVNTIPTLTASTSDFSPTTSAWGWRYGKLNNASDNDPNNKDFDKSPSYTKDTSIATSNSTLPTTTSNNEDYYYLTIGARVAGDQPKGTYTKDFVITATANSHKFNITYDANGGRSGTDSAMNYYTYTNTAYFTPTPSTTPTRKGYTFKGWCKVATDTNKCDNSTTLTCLSGKPCSLKMTDIKDDSATLYAVWESPFEANGVYSMQDWGRKSAADKTKILNALTTATNATNTAEDTQYTLYDERDNQRKYYVAKLSDGNIWMTENLDLNLATNKTLTTNDTDVPVNWTPANSTSSTWIDDINVPYSYDPGDRCWNGTITTNRNYSMKSSTVAKDCDKHASSHYHVGNYYNRPAAIAMNNLSNYIGLNGADQNMNQSICPKGWRLPPYEGNGSYKNLDTKVTFTTGNSGNVHKPPLYLPYSGYTKDTGNFEVGYYTGFHTSTLRGSVQAYRLDMPANYSLDTGNYYNRMHGISLRCVARTGGTEDISGPKTIVDISTMQQYGNLPKENKAAIKASMTTNTQYQLKDERDNKTYYVAKLADGNIWMTENLDLDLSTSKTLTPSDTDIPSNWTPTRNTLTTTTGWTDDNYTPYSYDPGNRCWNGTITSSELPISDATVAKNCNQHDSSHYHVGNYYNWSAAVAMNNTSSYTTGNMNQSICPKGWRLPVYNGDKSFFKLKTSANLTAGSSGNVHTSPFYFTYSGYFKAEGSNLVGGSGEFWSSYAASNTDATYYRFSSDGTNNNSQNRYARSLGEVIRCVARDE